MALAAGPVSAATIIVKQDGSGNAVTVQGGILLAASGDVVEIGDSATYTEDVTIGKSITLRAAEGQTPVIIATNTTPARGAWAIAFVAFEAPPTIPDDYGLYVMAPNVRLVGPHSPKYAWRTKSIRVQFRDCFGSIRPGDSELRCLWRGACRRGRQQSLRRGGSPPTIHSRCVAANFTVPRLAWLSPIGILLSERQRILSIPH